jgi:hypothetical protein
MKKFIGIIIPVFMLMYLSCSDNKSHTSIGRYDSLFLGFHFGMDKQIFYDICWERNKDSIFTHGPTNMEVEYLLQDSLLRQPVVMRFYPSFHEDKIYEMPVKFMYVPWSPWNRQYWGDSLMTDMLKIFKKWYGDDFESTEHKTMGTVYYKMDKYRRINLFVRDESFVQAVFTDMRVLEELKKQPGQLDESSRN